MAAEQIGRPNELYTGPSRININIDVLYQHVVANHHLIAVVQARLDQQAGQLAVITEGVQTLRHDTEALRSNTELLQRQQEQLGASIAEFSQPVQSLEQDRNLDALRRDQEQHNTSIARLNDSIEALEQKLLRPISFPTAITQHSIRVAPSLRHNHELGTILKIAGLVALLLFGGLITHAFGFVAGGLILLSWLAIFGFAYALHEIRKSAGQIQTLV